METLKLKAEHPILSWVDHEMKSEELQMIKNAANLPFIYKHVALMPDAHLGKGAMVGSVLATKNAIIPAAVGVDIGCGMIAQQLPLKASQFKSDKFKREIRLEIESRVPMGTGAGHKKSVKRSTKWNGWRGFSELHPNVQKLESKAITQLGSLGSGNHFIELCADTEGIAWVMLHSGSRHIGNQLALSHIRTAKELRKLSEIKSPDPDLAHFVQGTKEFLNYWNDLQWCQQYAKENREIMMDIVLNIIREKLGTDLYLQGKVRVNCHHNYSEEETHFGEKVFVTRKGAVRAREEDLGIIPGSMGAKSYIVRGKGKDVSFCSCSHGAGRRMSRTKAKQHFTRQDLEKQTNGVECRKDKGVLDEIPGAYKDIDQVMNNQSDLVEVVATLKQFICVKG